MTIATLGAPFYLSSSVISEWMELVAYWLFSWLMIAGPLLLTLRLVWLGWFAWRHPHGLSTAVYWRRYWKARATQNLEKTSARYRELRDLPAVSAPETLTTNPLVSIMPNLAEFARGDSGFEICQELIDDALCAARNSHVRDHRRLMYTLFSAINTIRARDPRRLSLSLIECRRLSDLSGHCFGQLHIAIRKWQAVLRVRAEQLHDAIRQNALDAATPDRLDELSGLDSFAVNCWPYYAAALSRVSQSAAEHGNIVLRDLVIAHAGACVDQLLRDRKSADFWDGLAITSDTPRDRYPRASSILDILGYLAYLHEQHTPGRAIALGERVVEAIPDLRDYFEKCCSLPDPPNRLPD